MQSSLTFPSTVSGPNDLSGLSLPVSLCLSARDIWYVFVQKQSTITKQQQVNWQWVGVLAKREVS